VQQFSRTYSSYTAKILSPLISNSLFPPSIPESYFKKKITAQYSILFSIIYLFVYLLGGTGV
jgi:hypothetical protein